MNQKEKIQTTVHLLTTAVVLTCIVVMTLSFKRCSDEINEVARVVKQERLEKLGSKDDGRETKDNTD